MLAEVVLQAGRYEGKAGPEWRHHARGPGPAAGHVHIAFDLLAAREIGRPAPRRALRGVIPPRPELEQRVVPCLRDVLLERVVDTEMESREDADGRPET